MRLVEIASSKELKRLALETQQRLEEIGVEVKLKHLGPSSADEEGYELAVQGLPYFIDVRLNVTSVYVQEKQNQFTEIWTASSSDMDDLASFCKEELERYREEQRSSRGTERSRAT